MDTEPLAVPSHPSAFSSQPESSGAKPLLIPPTFAHPLPPGILDLEAVTLLSQLATTGRSKTLASPSSAHGITLRNPAQMPFLFPFSLLMNRFQP